jgi:hypothetical protein
LITRSLGSENSALSPCTAANYLYLPHIGPRKRDGGLSIIQQYTL